MPERRAENGRAGLGGVLFGHGAGEEGSAPSAHGIGKRTGHRDRIDSQCDRCVQQHAIESPLHHLTRVGRAAQAGYTPSPVLLLTDRRQANDPLVHYTVDDLAPGQTVFTSPEGMVEVPLADGTRLRPGLGAEIGSEEQFFTNHLGFPFKVVSAHAPWGVNPTLGVAADVGTADANSTAYDVAYKDHLVFRSDDWNFPTNKFPSIGWMGRVHRGTPWQTL
jgi:hypothetical protein